MLTKNGPPMPTGRQGAGAIGDESREGKGAIDPRPAPGQRNYPFPAKVRRA